MKPWLRWSLIGCGAFLLTIFIVLAAIGVAIETGHLPDTMVLRAGELNQPTIDAIDAIVELGADEEILFFYSAGFLSYAEDGNLVTDQRVVSWGQGEGDEPDVWSIPWHEVTGYEVSEEDGLLMDSSIYVYGLEGAWLQLLFSNEDGIDSEVFAYFAQSAGPPGVFDERFEGEPWLAE